MAKYDFYANHDVLEPEAERELGLRARDGDIIAINELVKNNLRLVVFLVDAWWKPGLSLSFDEMVSEGTMGLMRAARGFDPDKGSKFSSYAAWWIKQAIRKALAEWDGPMRIPASTSLKRRPLKRFICEFKDKHGRNPDISEMREKFPNIGKKRIQSLIETLHLIHLNGPINQEDGCFGDIIQDDSAGLPIDSMIHEENPGEITRLMECLNERENEIILLRYGLDGKGVRTLEDVAERIGRTRERVRQIQKRALTKMRKYRDTGEKF